MASKSFFLRACKKVDENKKSYEEKAKETKQFSVRLVEMQQYVDKSEEKRQLLLSMLKTGKCPDNPEETFLNRGAVVYAKYLDVIDLIDKDLTENKINHLIITGKTKQGDREKIVKKFRANPANTVIIISDCASESISLHATNILIMYNCPGSAGRANQIWGRTARFGSEYEKFYIFYVIVDDTIDQYFPILLSSKKELEEEILKADYIDLKEQAQSFDARVLKEIRKELLWKTKKKKD